MHWNTVDVLVVCNNVERIHGCEEDIQKPKFSAVSVASGAFFFVNSRILVKVQVFILDSFVFKGHALLVSLVKDLTVAFLIR